MEGKLVSVGGPGMGREEVLRGDAVLVGRGSTCQIVVQDEQVSRQHAELRRQGDQWVVRDSGSANGTFVNNRRLGPGESVPLRPGDRLRLGPQAEFGFSEAYGVGGAAAYAPLATDYPPAAVYAEEPPKRGPSPVVIILALVAVLALVAAAFFAWRAFSGKGTGGQEGVAVTNGGKTGATTPAAAQTAARVVVQEPPTTLPAVSTQPIISAPTVKPPAVNTVASGQGGQAVAKGSAPSAGQVKGTAMPNIRPEQLPGLVATAFPNVPASELPAAIQGALQSGQVQPEAAQGFIGALFPGVPPAQLPTALAGSFAGFSPEQIQGILNSIYPGQNLQAPQIRTGEGAVAYGGYENPDYPDVYLLNADGSGKQLLVKMANAPAFSPDGRQIAYVSWRDDALGLRIRNLDTGEDRALTNSDYDLWPSWSPDGNRLVYYTWPDNLHVINADGADARGIGQGEFPAWSPDGRTLAFASNRDGNWEIYAVNADGSWLRRITDDIHTDGLPAWAPDGMRIAFRSDRTGTWAIYTASGAGGPPIKLADAPVHGEGRRGWDIERITWR